MKNSKIMAEFGKFRIITRPFSTFSPPDGSFFCYFEENQPDSFDAPSWRFLHTPDGLVDELIKYLNTGLKPDGK